MKKTMKRLSALLIGMMIALSSAMAVYADEGYTYNYDYWGDIQYSPDAYEVSGVYSAVDFGLETGLKTPSGLFVYEDMIYICDTGNNRILEIQRTGSQTLELIRVIDSFKGGEGPETFSSPQDVAVTDDGYIFIADTNNSRILKLDMDLNYVMEFTKPVDATFDQDLSFLPCKLAIDTAGRVYCVATNVNKGLIKFEADGEFSGFIGATEVTYDWTDYIWKRFATQAQREQMESFGRCAAGEIFPHRLRHLGFIETFEQFLQLRLHAGIFLFERKFESGKLLTLECDRDIFLFHDHTSS